MNIIIEFSLKNRLLVLLGAVLVIAGGIVSSRKMDVDVFPDLTAPTVVIMCDANGMSAEEIERLVTFPVETAVSGATYVRRVRSTSLYGYSFIWVEFDWGMDVYRARQIVSEKMVTLAESLPEGITPVLAPQSSVMGEIIFVGMTADSTGLMELRDLADWVVAPAILATGGVSQATVMGGDLKEYQIIADPARMLAYGVSMAEIEAVGRTLSVNTEGGVLREWGNEYALRGVARSTDLEELGSSRGTLSGDKPVKLSDVARLEIGAARKMGYGSVSNKEGIIISISKQPNINTLKVTRAIEKSREEISL